MEKLSAFQILLDYTTHIKIEQLSFVIISYFTFHPHILTHIISFITRSKTQRIANTDK